MELTYEQVAAELAVSERTVRRLITRHKRLIQPLVYSHKNRRFLRSQVLRLKRHLRNEAIKKGKSL